MKILIHTGNHFQRFAFSLWSERGGDNTLNQTIKMAQVFSSKGHDVTVSGDVTTEAHGGVTFTNTEDLKSGAHFDLVIGVSYIHYIAELESRDITWDKSIFHVHQHTHSAWWRGELMEDGGEHYFRDDRMNWVVALSDKHARSVSRTNPYATRKVSIIGGAIDPADWTSPKTKKVPGKIIFCSKNAETRANMLALWPRLKQERPDATLVAVSIFTGNDQEVHEQPEIDGVTYLGPLSAAQMREQILSSEYWLNPSMHEEEYGVTALEMMMGGVKIVSTGFGNLGPLLAERGAVVEIEDGDVVKSTLRTFLDYSADDELAGQNAKAARKFAEQQSWDARYEEWLALIATKPKPLMKHPELFSYFDDEKAWTERFLTYAARTREWDLIADEPFDSCFSVPLFTPEFCRMIREEAEYAESWTTDRHDFFPTTDLVLQVIGMEDIYRDLITEYIMPCARSLWTLPSEWNTTTSETFLAKYTADKQGHLSLHHDASDITCLIQLSDFDEYEGGGTYFSRQKQLVKNGIGYATLHPGQITHRHGARSISKGTRYILVSFITKHMD